MAPLKKYIVSKGVQLLLPYPGMYLKAKSLYFQKPLIKGIRLSCYGHLRATLEPFSDLGAGKNQVCVRVLRTALNTGTERANFCRLPGTLVEYPYTPAASGMGKIIKVGRGVRHLKVGDLVAGGLQHRSVQAVDAVRLVKIPSDLDWDQGAILHLAVIAMQGVRMGRIQAGQRVAVMGLGVIGRLAVLAIRAMGAEVVCVTGSRVKLDRFGEHQGVAVKEDGGMARLESIRAEVVIDATGDPHALSSAMAAAAPGGRVVLLGSSRGLSQLDPNGAAAIKGLSLIGAHISNQAAIPPQLGGDYPTEMNHLIKLIQTGALDLSTMITTRFPARNLTHYYNHRLMEDRESCAVLVNWDDVEGMREQVDTPLVFPAYIKRTAPEPKRIALVGCGQIGRINAAAVAASSGFELARVMDQDMRAAQALGEVHDVPHGDQYESVLADPNIDAVFLSVPHHKHAPMAMAGFAAGKHMMVEKPLAMNVAEAGAMIRAAQAAGRTMHTCYPMRYEPQKRMARALVDLDVVGKPMGVSVEFHRYRPLNYWFAGSQGKSMPGWRSRKDTAGGGFLIMNLVHVFDLLRYIFGLRVARIYALTETLYHPVEVEDTLSLSFTGHRGELGTFSAGSAVKGMGGGGIRFWGESGQIEMNWDELRYYSARRLGSYPAERWNQVKLPPSPNTRALLLDAFFDDIQAGRTPDFEEPGFQDIAVIQAAYQSARQDRPVMVEDLLAEGRDV